jgi:hypothetical protein
MLRDKCGEPVFVSRRARQAAIRKAVSSGNEQAIDSKAMEPVFLLRRNRVE